MNANEQFYENRGLAVWSVNRYFPNLSADEDILQEAFIGLWKACLTYDSKKAKFATYAVTCIKNQVLMALRKRRKDYKLPVISMEEAATKNKNGEALSILDTLVDPSECPEETVRVKEYLSTLCERDRLLLCLRMNGLSQKEAGKALGVSQAQCSRYLKQLREDYTKGEYR